MWALRYRDYGECSADAANDVNIALEGLTNVIGSRLAEGRAPFHIDVQPSAHSFSEKRRRSATILLWQFWWFHVLAQKPDQFLRFRPFTRSTSQVSK
jgi:hypothetical protein